MNTTIEKIVETTLINNRIGNYDKKDLELQLQIHPNYPSFQSITDTLDYFDIDNIAVEVPSEALDQLPECFITLITLDNKEEIVTVIKKGNNIELKHTGLKKNKLTLEEFKDIWVPKVIAVEYNTKQKLISDKSIFQNLILAGLCISTLFVLYNRPWVIHHLVFIALSITGTILSFFAIRESLGIQSQTIHQFCTSVGNTNCGEVINNNSGKLFPNFSLADAGMAFFGSILLHQLFYGFNSTLLVSSLIGIPFIAYSLYSQAFIIKKWCAICLAMGSVSIGLVVIAILNIPIKLDLLEITSFIIVASLFTLGFLYAKEKIKENKKFKAENLKLNHFKRDEQIYNHLFNSSERIEDNKTIPHEIVLGNPNATFKIISLTNPMCGYCKDAFEAYTRTLKTMGDQIQIIIRLNIKHNDVNDKATQIALTLFDIYRNQGADKFILAYNNWFADRTHSKWLKKHAVPQNTQEYVDILKQQSEWADKNNLYYTPATLINTKLYPKKYNYQEFFHFMSMMIENHTNQLEESHNAVTI
ncbi:vitamin K epoxide reductase family protein [Aquimarina aquimarini]|uniref:vitamin K epoxide reductase family protein n=1 Tax=Aquimarina aquimarini TaxID=1191734 RepID=UPI000D55C1CF|nr:vitamin K epoxide reductase family protein [Aquimarina aquimarini]